MQSERESLMQKSVKQALAIKQQKEDIANMLAKAGIQITQSGPRFQISTTSVIQDTIRGQQTKEEPVSPVSWHEFAKPEDSDDDYWLNEDLTSAPISLLPTNPKESKAAQILVRSACFSPPLSKTAPECPCCGQAWHPLRECTVYCKHRQALNHQPSN